jgi:hypothetical protein
MHRHHPRLIAREDKPATRPDVAALAAGSGAEFGRFKFLVELLEARPVVPQQDGFLRQLTEESPGLFPAAQIRAIDADHDLLQIRDVLQLARDQAQALGSDFPNVTRQHEGDGCLVAERADVPLEAFEIRWPEPVKSGNSPRLEKVGHERNSSASMKPSVWKPSRTT